MNTDILNELKILCELELSLIENGKILADEEGYFAHSTEQERLKGLDSLQDKYHYGWYIAAESLTEQLQSINEFKLFIIGESKIYDYKH